MQAPAARERFTAVFEKHYADVLRYALRRTDPSHAQDVAAETLAIAWGRFDRVPEDALPWLYVTARNVLDDILVYDLPPDIPSEIPREPLPENLQEIMPSPWPTEPHSDALPGGFPSDFPIPAGAELVSSEVSDDGLVTVRLRMASEGSGEVGGRVAALYNRGLPDGWTAFRGGPASTAVVRGPTRSPCKPSLCGGPGTSRRGRATAPRTST